MSDSVWPQRWQPTRLPCPWDSPGKNAGVGCHFLLQCMKVKSESEVTQSCLTPSDPMDCSLPASSIMGFARQEYWSGVPLPSPKATIIKAQWSWCKNKHINQWKGIEIPEVNSCWYGQLISDKGGKSIQQGKDNLFNK